MKKILLIITLLIIKPIYADELLIATTLSTEATAYIIEQWQKINPNITIQTLNRTSSSIERLAESPFGDSIDLIISSSPILFSHLKDNDKLSLISAVPKESGHYTPSILQNYVAAFALSGYGILSNKNYLEQHHQTIPKTWQDLTRHDYFGMISISSPARSDTTHIMIESILQEFGWEKGWQILMEIGGNIGTISSRSFGVVDKINSDLSIIGITIDSYANVNHNDKLVFNYFPNNTPIPTFIAILNQSQHSESAQKFIKFLLSPEGQLIVANPNTGKYPIILGIKESNEYVKYANFMKTEHINYETLLERQELVKQLFDVAITFRLEQLKESWGLLYSIEKKTGKSLDNVRELLTKMPINEMDSLNYHIDKQSSYLSKNVQEDNIKWRNFFQNQHQKAIELLENISQ